MNINKVDARAVMVNATAWALCAQDARSMRDSCAALDNLIEAIKPFTHPDLCKQLPGNNQGDDSPIYGRDKAVLKLGDFRRLAAALTSIVGDA